MNPASLALPLILGGAGAAWHIAFTALRARSLVKHGLNRALWLLPLAFAGPAVVIVLASRVAPSHAWLAALSLVLCHRALVVGERYRMTRRTLVAPRAPGAASLAPRAPGAASLAPRPTAEVTGAAPGTATHGRRTANR